MKTRLFIVLVFTINLISINSQDIDSSKNYTQVDLDNELLTICKEGNYKELSSLIVKGANVNATDKYGNSPLHYASNTEKKGGIEAVKFLVSKGAETNSTNNAGSTPLVLAAHTGQTEIVSFLLEKKAIVNAKDSTYSPLHAASLNGYSEIAKLLIDKGASINAKDKDGYTPLRNASFKGSMEIVKLLIANKAEVNAVDNFNNTPFL